MNRRILASAIVASVFANYPAFSQQVFEPGLTIETVVSGISKPTSMLFVGPNIFLLNEQSTGRVRVVMDDQLRPAPALDLSVAGGLEPGLHGIVKDPEFDENGYVYLYYSSAPSDGAGATAIRISRFTWTGSELDAASEFVLHELPVTSTGHHGGILAMGNDGTLYAGIGDQHQNTQTSNFDTPNMMEVAVVVRMNLDGTVPADNPFDAPGWEYVFAYGVRNQYGLGIDPLTGWLWQSENGPSSPIEEVNLLLPGANSGWEDVFGFPAVPPTGLHEVPGSHYSDPEFVFGVRAAPTAVTFQVSPILGGDLWNDVYVGEGHFSSNHRIFRFELNEDRDAFSFEDPDLSSDLIGNSYPEMQSIIFADGFGIIADIEFSPQGFMYVTTWSGTVYRIRPDHPTGDGEGDGDIDHADFAAMQRCFTAPGGTASELCRDAFDLDEDLDIDLDDFEMFLSQFSGPLAGY